tara:strand:+ start:1355 stop:1993 length:639 start_codon:yes stop_codon:yes gene_type:complete
MGFDTQYWVDEFLKVEKRIKICEDISFKSIENLKKDTITIGKTGEEYMGFNPTEEEVNKFNWDGEVEDSIKRLKDNGFFEALDKPDLNNNMKVPREFGEDKQSQEDSYAGTGVYLDIDNDYTTPSGSAKRASTIVGGVYDAGLHYRKKYKGIKLDPFRIAQIYNLDGIQLTILKKTLVTGERGSKDILQDYKDIINAATRAIEMIEEDNNGR